MMAHGGDWHGGQYPHTAGLMLHGWRILSYKAPQFLAGARSHLPSLRWRLNQDKQLKINS